MGNAVAEKIPVCIDEFVDQGIVGPKQSDFIIRVRQAHAAAIYVIGRQSQRHAV